MIELIWYFILTFISDLIIISIILKKFKLINAVYIILINLFTWPLANLFYGEGLNYLITETLVVITESLLILLMFKIKYLKSLIISLVGNTISASLIFLKVFS